MSIAHNADTKYYSPSSDLITYFTERLQLERLMLLKEKAGGELSTEEDRLERSLRTSKSRILDKLSQEIADLTFFFESIYAHKELLDIFDNDIKDILGLKQEQRLSNQVSNGQRYPIFFHPQTFHRLLKAILAVDSRTETSFRRALPDILRQVMYEKMSGQNPRDLPNDIYKLMLEDLGRTAAWTSSYASEITKDKIPYHRALGYSFRPIITCRSYAFELVDRGKIL